MSREFLRTCSNTLPLLVETVEAVRRYIEGGTDSFIMTVAHGEEEEGRERGRKRRDALMYTRDERASTKLQNASTA